MQIFTCGSLYIVAGSASTMMMSWNIGWTFEQVAPLHEKISSVFQLLKHMRAREGLISIWILMVAPPVGLGIWLVRCPNTWPLKVMPISQPLALSCKRIDLYTTMNHIARTFDPLNFEHISFNLRQKPKWACISRMPLKPRILCAQWLIKSKTFRAKIPLASRCLAPNSLKGYMVSSS